MVMLKRDREEGPIDFTESALGFGVFDEQIAQYFAEFLEMQLNCDEYGSDAAFYIFRTKSSPTRIRICLPLGKNGADVVFGVSLEDLIDDEITSHLPGDGSESRAENSEWAWDMVDRLNAIIKSLNKAFPETND